VVVPVEVAPGALDVAGAVHFPCSDERVGVRAARARGAVAHQLVQCVIEDQRVVVARGRRWRRGRRVRHGGLEREFVRRVADGEQRQAALWCECACAGGGGVVGRGEAT
jgi:hypothetical protein